MPPSSLTKKNNCTGMLFLILSTISCFYWLSGNLFSIYQFAFVGAVFEILWLPMLAILFILPIAAFIFWVKDKYRIRSFYLYSILVSLITIIVLITGILIKKQ
jgi:hypothetical protein